MFSIDFLVLTSVAATVIIDRLLTIGELQTHR